jgi:hypothetical protein
VEKREYDLSIYMRILRKFLEQRIKGRVFMVTTEYDLEEGEVICNVCDGGGSYPKKFAELEDPKYLRCYKCNGAGKLDWVTNVMGVKTKLLDRYGLRAESEVSLYYEGKIILETRPNGILFHEKGHKKETDCSTKSLANKNCERN